MPAVMERRAGKYRYQLLLQADKRVDLHRLLGPWTMQLNKLPEARKVRWSLDVDPVDLI
jgi:primosomal protein N' (replication factor Y)